MVFFILQIYKHTTLTGFFFYIDAVPTVPTGLKVLEGGHGFGECPVRFQTTPTDLGKVWR